MRFENKYRQYRIKKSSNIVTLTQVLAVCYVHQVGLGGGQHMTTKNDDESKWKFEISLLSETNKVGRLGAKTIEINISKRTLTDVSLKGKTEPRKKPSCLI